MDTSEHTVAVSSLWSEEIANYELWQPFENCSVWGVDELVTRGLCGLTFLSLLPTTFMGWWCVAVKNSRSMALFTLKVKGLLIGYTFYLFHNLRFFSNLAIRFHK